MGIFVQSSIFIARPPEAVAGVILDPEKTVLWTSDLESFEVLSGKPGEVGSAALLHYVQDGKPYVMRDELVAAEPMRRYVSRVSGEALTAEVETWLEPLDDGTRVTVHWSGSPNLPLLRIVLPFMRGRIAKQARKDLEKLKALVEGISPLEK